MNRCSMCNSHSPALHPALQLGGEVQPCSDGNGATSRLCCEGEHLHCGGQIKYASLSGDNVDDCWPCECSCHGKRVGP